MITPSSSIIGYKTPFTITINVTDDLGDPILDIPTVNPSFVDPGVTISTTTATIEISGEYQAIIPIVWYWLNLKFEQLSADVPPSAGSYSKIFRVDSPTSLTEICTYTIDSSEGTELFSHTVDLGSYTPIADELKSLLAGAPPDE